MENKVRGLHHLTAIAGNAKRNLQFYTKILGLRLVKRTVNFDDPYTYHLYYGDETGSPGSILTFFPWDGVRQGVRGVGMATEFGFSVPEGSMDFWLDRFKNNRITYNNPATKFGETYLTFLDPDGLKMEMTVADKPDGRKAWKVDDIPEEMAVRGFHQVTISLTESERTARVLNEALGYEFEAQETNRMRFRTSSVEHGAIIDLVEVPGERTGLVAGGTLHHVAFCVDHRDDSMELREKLLDMGLSPTPLIDRNYFRSVYFREPGGTLFEIATRKPGFLVDESKEELGTALKLPKQYEKRREELEDALPELD